MSMHLVIASLGFPAWLRVTHFINLLFIGLLIRSGLQILAAHPRLYWNDNCTPGKEWIKFTRKKVPVNKDVVYTSLDDEIDASPWLALPGGKNLGIGRHWHFFTVIFWVLNGVIYVALLFGTGEWSRLIPTSWSIFPDAWHTFLTYITFHIPPASDFHPYDPLQQLAYAAVVFLLAPFMLLTGATMSPAVAGRFPWYIKLFGGRQVGRSLHFLSLLAFLGFIVIHTALVLIVHFQNNIRDIVLGSDQTSFAQAGEIAIAALVFVLIVYVWSTLYSARHRRKVQHALGSVIDPTRRLLLHGETSVQHYKEADISPYFWVNGAPPTSEEYRVLGQNNFRDWKLEVCGLVKQPLCLSLEDLRALPATTQITKHNCIQGWSGVGKWTGVCVSEILDRCQPLPEARYLVFTSYGLDEHSLDGVHYYPFYEVIDFDLARHPQTILAYDLNGEPLPIPHGAPLRLRVETVLGYKMVKYLRSIELVARYDDIRAGQGGSREDTMYYGRGAEI
ncbi:MAG TPA: molybdopterin-dependent oxidoreductase [Ktedonobacteraceae bacterium]|nr:molybdopterin-dependent oxidoreductase [Ktedonobacteraceae bacterium]